MFDSEWCLFHWLLQLLTVQQSRALLLARFNASVGVQSGEVSSAEQRATALVDVAANGGQLSADARLLFLDLAQQVRPTNRYLIVR